MYYNAFYHQAAAFLLSIVFLSTTQFESYESIPYLPYRQDPLEPSLSRSLDLHNQFDLDFFSENLKRFPDLNTTCKIQAFGYTQQQSDEFFPIGRVFHNCTGAMYAEVIEKY